MRSLTARVAGAVADGVEVIFGPQDQTITNEGRRGQGHFAKVVGTDQFVFSTGADHKRAAFFVHTEDLAVVTPGRCGEIATLANSSFVRLQAGLCVKAREDAGVVEDIESSVIGQFGRQISSGLGLKPGDEIIRSEEHTSELQSPMYLV